jgi:hypothetical protein
MESQLMPFIVSCEQLAKVLFSIHNCRLFYVAQTIGFCYHLANAITLSLLHRAITLSRFHCRLIILSL